jgi:ribosome-binding protein aMBF1 (putative translation factor)
MKSRLEKVYSKLPKVELAKVELGVADDIAKMQSTLQKSMSDADSKLKEFKDAKDEFAKAETKALKVRATASKISGGYDKIISSAQKVLDKAEKAAKDLGVSPSGIAGFNSLEDLAVGLDDKKDDVLNFDFDLGQ